MLLLLLCVGVVTSNVLWLRASDVQVAFDLPVHGRIALALYEAVGGGRWFDVVTLPYERHGPASYLAGVASMVLLGPSLRNLFLASTVLALLYAWAVYQIGKMLYDPSTGFWAAVYGLTIPLFVDVSKQYPLELSSHAFTMVALMLLFKSDWLRRSGYALLFGLVLGLALLTKTETAAMWSLPLAVLVLGLLRDGVSRPAVRAAVIVGSVGVAIALVRAYPDHHLDGAAWIHAHPFAYLSAGATVVIAAILGGDAMRRRAGIGQARLCHLVAALALTAVVIVPRVCSADLAHIANERISSAIMGADFGQSAFDPSTELRLVLSRAWHWFYAALATAGAFCFVCTYDRRDLRRCFLYGMLVFIVALLVAIPSKFEYYRLNLAGFSAVLATGWLRRGRGAGVAVRTALTVWALLQGFGWVLLPASAAPEDLRPLQTFHDPDLESLRITGSWWPILPEPPRPDVLRHQGILQAAAADARGAFVLLVLPTPEVFTIYNADCLRMFALYEGLEAFVVSSADDLDTRIGMADDLRAAPEREQVRAALQQVPCYLLVQSEQLPRDPDAEAEAWFAQAFSREVPVVAKRLNGWTAQGWFFTLFRLRERLPREIRARARTHP